MPEDREYVIREMKLARVVEQLEEHGVHIIYCGIEDPVRGYTRKRLEYRYYDREEQMVLLSRTDLTDLYLEQQRQQKVLKEALEMAEEANRVKSLFFSNMSHDIRTPMNAIVGYATLLDQEAYDEGRVRQYTQKILNSSRLLLSLLNDVLDISQIESGKTVRNISAINIPALVNELDTMLRPQTQARNQIFHVQIESLAHQYVSGDQIHITQILMNVLNNAVKYTPEGGRIDFTVRSTGHPTGSCDEIVFMVRDTGIGISKEFIKDIFEPFSREKNAIVDKIQGTGLGMAITKSLVDFLDGRITVESEPGKGSTFMIRFCLGISNQEKGAWTDEPKDAPRQEDGSQNVEKAKGRPLEGIHILAAEDNMLNAEILSELLKMAGAECEMVSNGREAVQRFEELSGTCDLILMDIRMPVMDGCEAARNIRGLSCEKAKTIPIIALTANAFTEDVSMALDSGMDAHLAKPVDTDKLYETILEYIR